MNIDLYRLATRSMWFGFGGLGAILAGWAILAATFGGGGGLYDTGPSVVGLVLGWMVVAVGAMAIQASIVGWLIAGSGPGPRTGDEGVVMRDEAVAADE